MKAVIFVVAASLLCAGQASGSDVDRSFCIRFEPGTMTNSCAWDLDVTWCESDSVSRCTDQWKSSYVRAQGRSTVSFDRDDLVKFVLKYACDKDDSDCLEARNAFKDSKSR